MRILKSFAAAFVIFILHACSGQSNASHTPPAESPALAATMPAETNAASTSETLPSFAVTDASGNTIDLKTFAGKKVFVNLWATWCPPCRAEMPSIEKLYQTANKDKVQFVMLSLDKDFETAKAYISEKGFSLPVFYPAADLPPLFSVNGIPTTFIFNEQGKLVMQREGSENYNTRPYHKLFDGK